MVNYDHLERKAAILDVYACNGVVVGDGNLGTWMQAKASRLGPDSLVYNVRTLRDETLGLRAGGYELVAFDFLGGRERRWDDDVVSGVIDILNLGKVARVYDNFAASVAQGVVVSVRDIVEARDQRRDLVRLVVEELLEQPMAGQVMHIPLPAIPHRDERRSRREGRGAEGRAHHRF